jgi:hypothetical protein
MSRILLFRWHSLLGAVLPLLAALAFPGAVKATCGDYVMVGTSHAEHRVPLSPARPISDPAKPCDGPLCQERQDVPLAPPPSQATVFASDLYCFLSQDDAPTLNRPGWACLSDLQLPVQRANDIFHPPRQIAA